MLTSTPRSVLTATIVSGFGQGEHDIDLHNIELFQYIGAVNMPQASLTGSLSAAAGFRGLNLGDLTGPGQISIGPLPTGVAINPALAFHNVSDFSIESLSRIRAIRAAQWIETDGIPNRIEAVSIGGIEIAGNLEAGISLGALGGISVGGFLKNADLVTTNNVGLVSVGGLDHANIYIGTTARPGAVSDFALVRSLGRLAVHGVTGFSQAFIASNVAASRIGSILVTGVAGDSSPGDFGIVADAINSYLRLGGPRSGPRVLPQSFDTLGSYSLKIV